MHVQNSTLASKRRAPSDSFNAKEVGHFGLPVCASVLQGPHQNTPLLSGLGNALEKTVIIMSKKALINGCIKY